MQGNNHAKLHIFFVLTTSNAELLYQSPLKKGVIAKKQPPKPRNLSLRSFLLHFLLLKSGYLLIQDHSLQGHIPKG